MTSETQAIIVEVLERVPLTVEELPLPFVDRQYSKVHQIGPAVVPGQPLVFVSQAAATTTREHTASRTDTEVGGLLVGRFARHGDIDFVLVEAAVPAFKADG